MNDLPEQYCRKNSRLRAHSTIVILFDKRGEKRNFISFSSIILLLHFYFPIVDFLKHN